MTTGKIIYEPQIELRFSQAEIDLLRECAEHHYDGTCQAAARQGGLLYGCNPEAPNLLKFREVDLLAKIVEMQKPSALSYQLSAPCFGRKALVRKSQN
jgi:hypothetical protein